MIPLSATNAAAGTAAANASSTTAAQKQTLGAQDFLKLLTVQLQTQDPLDPMKDTDFIAQMANFTSLEQMRELTSSFGEFQEQQQRMAAQAYLGKEVTLADNVSGIVTAIEQAEDGSLIISVGEHAYPISDIRRVKLPEQQATDE